MMSELLFVLKCFALTAAIVTLSQVPLRGETLEDRMDQALRTSPVAQWVQSAAAGGALAINHAAQSVKNGMNDLVGSEKKQPSRFERAGR